MVNSVSGDCGTSIFEEMSRLAASHGAINLGQGFPVGLEPVEVLDAAARALREGSQQYPPMMGLTELREAVAAANRRFWGIAVDSQTEVLVTSGATEALADCFLGLLDPGDEVIVFQPAYDSYGFAIRRAGGVPVPIRLEPPHWTLPRQRIVDAITPRTRLGPDEQLSLAGSAGRPALNHDLVVARLTDDGSPTNPANPAAAGEVGEIVVRGPCMMGGYLNRPEANHRALAHGWYHTGDLGELDENGVLWIRDRIDHMINSGAENVYPREVEDALIAHPDVIEVAVIGEADPVWGQVVAAHIVAKPSSGVSPEALDRFLVDGDRLAHYKRPRRYHLVDDLPKTTSGKIQKHLLRPTGNA